MKTMAWFLTSIVPLWLLMLGLANRSDPSVIDFYGFLGLPLALALTVAFVGRTVVARDLRTSQKFAWIAVLVVLLPFSIALPVFAFSRIVKSPKATATDG
jgi:hypothetical protein